MARSPRFDVRSEDAAEIAEAALVLPLVFMFLLGIVWFGRAFNIYTTVTQAAQQGAITAARPTCSTCGNTFPVNGDATTSGTVVYAVASVLKASNLDPAQIPFNTNPPSPSFCPSPPFAAGGACTTTSNITICREVLLNAPTSTGQPPVCGTLVAFQYPFQFHVPFTSTNAIRLTGQAQSRMEQ